MVRAAREPLECPVEVDDAFIGGQEKGVRGRETFKKAKIVVLIEVPGELRRVPGRVRIGQVSDFSKESLIPFIRQNVMPGGKVFTDDWAPYKELGNHGYEHQVFDKEESLTHVHRTISLLKRWLLGTHHGAVRPKQLQHYLEEFTFRHNRRRSTHVGKIFHRMLQGAAATAVVPYWKLVGRSAPDQPLPIGDT
jgi:transposase-like protein